MNVAPLAILIALTACTGSSADSDDGGPDGILPEGVSALAGTDATLTATDLAAFDAVVANATYIGLGEAVHTSGGFYAMKRRLIEHLVRDSGLRVFAMETPRTDARTVDAYLSSSCARSTEALRYIFSVFVDDNTQALFEWLCAWNADHPTDRVRFFGFDAQQPAQDVRDLDFFLGDFAAASHASLIAGLDHCQLAITSDTTYPETDYATCLTGIDSLDAYLAAHRDELVTAAGAEKVRLAEIDSISFRSYQGQQRYYDNDYVKSNAARDVAMHQIFAALRDLYFPGERVILWAHNYHLMRDHTDVEDYTPRAMNFGEELATEVGDDAYAPIGFTGRDIGINWPGVNGTDFGPVSTPSLTQRLVDLAQPYLFVDTKAAWVGTTPQVMRDNDEGTIDIGRQYAGMIYLDVSPAMNAVYW